MRTAGGRYAHVAAVLIGNGLLHGRCRLAGGIGVALNTAMNLFQWDRVAVVLLAIFVVVIVAEVVVTWVRGRIL